jgi:hypothetical protein
MTRFPQGPGCRRRAQYPANLLAKQAERKMPRTLSPQTNQEEPVMGFGRGLLLWLLGIPLPIIILLALFWHN